MGLLQTKEKAGKIPPALLLPIQAALRPNVSQGMDVSGVWWMLGRL
jgi:hypothetical protein